MANTISDEKALRSMMHIHSDPKAQDFIKWVNAEIGKKLNDTVYMLDEDRLRMTQGQCQELMNLAYNIENAQTLLEQLKSQKSAAGSAY